jgi:CheY-like chemotaxis protein
MSKSSKLKGVVVLVVDDSPDSLFLMAELLIQQGAEVLTAENATQALRIVASSAPQVLLSDIAMPGMDGYALIRKIRELEALQPGNAKIPAAAVTAFADARDRDRALQAGFQYHVSKPFDVAELVTLVARLAGRSASPIEQG